MIPLMYIITSLIFLIFLAFSVHKSLHMFQLNSYKVKTHTKWLKDNSRWLIPGILPFLLASAIIIFSIPEIWALTVLSVITAIISVIIRPRPAKKPIVYTKRLNRLIATVSLLTVISFSYFAITLNPIAYFVSIGVLSLLSPVLSIIANIVNKPMELAINKHFINDAKKMLCDNKDLIVIGVTGSYGKTSVKYILHTLLQAEYNVLMTPESYNTPMGVVITIRNQLRATHQIFVCEMGARHVGDIKEICDIVNPDYGIITSIGPQHLETFGTIENIINTKFELADAIPAGNTVFLNGENENIRSHRTTINNKSITYGLSDSNDYYATDISLSPRGTVFTVVTPSAEKEEFITKLVGTHNVTNIVGAISICCELGIPLRKLKAQIRKLESIPHRLQLIERNGITIIDDAYNSNPAGSRAALDALALFDGYKILLTPGMVELGEKQDELNYEFGAYAAKVCDYVILVGKKQTHSIFDGLVSAGYDKSQIYIAETFNNAIEKAYSLNSTKRKVILLENDLPDNY